MKNNKEEIISRRDFFKKVTQKTLPVLGVIALGSQLTSCMKIENEDPSCTDCTAVCSSNCTQGCKGSCSGSCGSNCSGACKGSCSRTCMGGCDMSCLSGCKGVSR